MSFEETLVCDCCSRVLDGGPREQTIRSLRDEGGRAFDRGRRGKGWIEQPKDEPWASTRRHLCGRCASSDKFYDAEAVPAEEGEPRA